MPTVNLHHKTVGNLPLPPTGRTRYWDETTSGLHVLATPTGRVYKARFQRPDGTKIDFRIGLVEDWSLSKAREQAEKCVEAAKTGDDPQVRKRKAKSKEETFGVLAEKCMKSLSLRPNTRKNWNGLVKNYLVPKFGNTDAASIDRKMIRTFIARLGEEKPVQAARVFEVMRRIFSWGVENDEIHGTPFAGLKKPEKVQAADSIECDRYLSRVEIHRVFATLKNERFTGMDSIKPETSASLPDFDNYIRLLFETAVRRDEMLMATWAEVDMDAGFFTIRTLRYKSKKPHQVPLTPTALKALKAIRNQDAAEAALRALRLQIQDKTDGDERAKMEARAEAIEDRMRAVAASPYVFPGPKPEKPRTSVQRTFEDLRRRVGFAENWTLHDIRRTVATELDRAGTPPHVKEAILGHAPDKLTRTYSKHIPLLEMRRALDTWSKELDSIIATAPTVHAFPRETATA